MPDELTTVAVFDNPIQAAIARNYLEAEGITAFLADEATVGMAWHLSGAVGGVKLLVAGDQLEKTRALLDQLEQKRAGEARSGEGSEDEERTTDLAESAPDEDLTLSAADELADRAFRAAILGVFFCPLQLYSLGLLISLLMLDEAASPKMQKRAAMASVLDLCFFGYLLLFATLALQ